MLFKLIDKVIEHLKNLKKKVRKCIGDKRVI